MTPFSVESEAVDTPQNADRAHGLFAAGSHARFADHERQFGPLPLERIDANFMGDLERSGLTGRGGAAFSSWRKLAATDSGRGRGMLAAKPVVIANGAEGEPLSSKDKTLLVHAPHLVIDGLLIAAAAVKATQLYIYATPIARSAVEAAVAERRDARRIVVVEAPETFISGEASAVVNSIANGIALPQDKVQRLSDSGLKGRPTLVLNVETLAHTALIARFGADWFRAAGSERDPGTRLVSISGRGHREVLEVAGDARLPDVLADAGVELQGLAAVLVGGYHGRWVRPLDYRLSPVGTATHAVRPGAGVLHLLDSAECGLAATAEIVNYLAGESAKQCGPCMFGLPAMARTFSALAYGDQDPRLPQELQRLASLVVGRGACHHPDGTVQLIASALETFKDDVAAHLGGACTRSLGRP